MGRDMAGRRGMKSNYALAGLAVVVAGGALWLALAFLGNDDAPALEGGLGPERVEAEVQAPLDVPTSSEPESRVVVEETGAPVDATVVSPHEAWDGLLQSSSS